MLCSVRGQSHRAKDHRTVDSLHRSCRNRALPGLVDASPIHALIEAAKTFCRPRQLVVLPGALLVLTAQACIIDSDPSETRRGPLQSMSRRNRAVMRDPDPKLPPPNPDPEPPDGPPIPRPTPDEPGPDVVPQVDPEIPQPQRLGSSDRMTSRAKLVGLTDGSRFVKWQC